MAPSGAVLKAYMTLTTSWRTTQLHMTLFPYPAATRVLARGSSSWSR